MLFLVNKALMYIKILFYSVQNQYLLASKNIYHVVSNNFVNKLMLWPVTQMQPPSSVQKTIISS